jgi:type II secretory pathway component PulM
MTFDPRLLLNSFNRLAPRERWLLAAAVGSLLVISVYSFVWEPLDAGRELLGRRITARERELTEIQRQRDTYLKLVRQLEANKGTISEGDPNFNLLASLQTTISQAVSRDHIASMNPSTKNRGPDYQEQLVEIKLTQISLPQLVDLLYRVEKGDHPLRFSRLQIKKRYNDIHNFDVTATVSLLAAAGS